MKLNLEKIYFCTGARNHDLLKLFDQYSIKFEYDERMASFKALGLSKITKVPVAVCTTSGTAVAQCVPAMLEAFYSENPLVLISGDRPKKLHGTGSPQTIEHESLTRSCRRTFIEVDLSELPSLTLDDVQFPVHINVLVDDTAPHSFDISFDKDFSGFESFMGKSKSPLFLFSHEKENMRKFIEKFKATDIPFYAESLSGGRDLSTIRTEKKLVELFQAGYFDAVVRVGHTPLNKIWRLLEKKPIPVFHFDSRNLPSLSFGRVLQKNSQELLHEKRFWKALTNLNSFKIADETEKTLHDLISSFPESEISYFHKIQEKIPEGSLVYLGNSLVVRFFELTQKKKFIVHGNRGVNGIDGQLASAIGLASGVSEDVYCILGDVTTFYDLSSMREMPQNLHLVIMNNRGGRIFDMLNLDKRIVLEHENDFKNISQGLGLSYSNDLKDFGHVAVLELFPERAESDKMLRGWMK